MEDLIKYQRQKESLKNISDKVVALKLKYQAIRCANTDSTPVQGGTSRVEDNMLDNIVERQRLEYTYKATKRLVELVERGLAGLSDSERLVLSMFYINRPSGHIEVLMNKLNLERTRVYELKDKALYRFTMTVLAKLFMLKMLLAVRILPY